MCQKLDCLLQDNSNISNVLLKVGPKRYKSYMDINLFYIWRWPRPWLERKCGSKSQAMGLSVT